MLGVAKDATGGEIRKAYRKLAQVWHPDKAAADRKVEATAKFASISVAYEKIGTPDARAMYDDFGEHPGGFDTYADFMASGKKASNDLYQGEQYVTRLTDDNWDEKVRALSSTGETLYWFVNMYAPWCSHCINAAPEYKVAAERMDGEVEFGAINCVDNVKVCKDKWQIRSYPTLMMISPRYDMHAQWPNNVAAQGKWAEVLPQWARETRDEWERTCSTLYTSFYLATHAAVIR